MRAAVAVSQHPDDPLSSLVVKDVPDPLPPAGWTRVRVKAAALNLHDVWTLRGVGHSPENIPIVLGCDAAGVTEDGLEVIVHPVLGDPAAGGGDVTLDPGRSLLSETIDGAFAEYLIVPTENLVPKPPWLTFEEAAALPVAWGTAYRMLFTRGNLKAGDRVLVQGSSGGVASAAIALASAAGARVYATGRSEAKRAYAIECGATESFDSGARLPERVDLVIETVGEATWAHSLRALRPGGTLVIAGATAGSNPPADLSRIFYLQQRIIGSTGCTHSEFDDLLRMMDVTGVRPRIDRVVPLEDIKSGFEALMNGDVMGKIVVSV
jgi:NADPH:quinone reductase-like Zn-dependent oxidoreductase